MSAKGLSESAACAPQLMRAIAVEMRPVARPAAAQSNGRTDRRGGHCASKKRNWDEGAFVRRALFWRRGDFHHRTSKRVALSAIVAW